MKRIECNQGSIEWFAARAGKPTASNASKLITPTGKPSAQSESLLCNLLAEIIMGHPIDTVGTEWMERGRELEPEAVKAYELLTDTTTEKVGFIVNDEETYGCSPDRLVGDNGLLEIKCCSPGVHVAYLLNRRIEQEKFPQIQMQLLVTGREYCDVFAYHPDFPNVNIRVPRDEEYITKLETILSSFTATLAEKRTALQSQYKI